MMSATNRRLPPEEEHKLWKYIYRNFIVDKRFGNMLELFNGYQQSGKLIDYFPAEINNHFFQFMIPKLYKTDALEPSQILELYRELQITVRTPVERLLNMYCTEPVRLDEHRRLLKWSISWPERSVEDSHRVPTNSFNISWQVELAMWRHIARNSASLTAVKVRLLRFWRTLELRDVTPQLLLEYFLSKVRYTLFALKLDADFKMTLIRDLRVKLAGEHIKWLFRVERVLVETDGEGMVRRWARLTEEDSRNDKQTIVPAHALFRDFGTPPLEDSMILNQIELAETCVLLKEFVKKSARFYNSDFKRIPEKVKNDEPDVISALKCHVQRMHHNPAFSVISSIWKKRQTTTTTTSSSSISKQPFCDLEDYRPVLVVTLSEGDEIVAPSLESQPKMLTFRKRIKPKDDILKFVNEFQRPPIFFNERGVSFVRADLNVEMTIEDRSKAAIIEIRRQNSTSEPKRRWKSPVCSPNRRKRPRTSSEH